MNDSKIKRLIYALVSIAVLLWINFNPYTDIKFIENSPVILDCVNNFFSNLNLSYVFSAYDIYSVFKFTEYFIFGIILSITFKSCSKNTFWSIFSIFFLGLSVSLSEIHKFYETNIATREVTIAFAEYCAGVAMWALVHKFKRKSKTRLKYKSVKYGGRC